MEERSKNEPIKYSQKTIVITGAESTGKSTLTEELANHYNVPFISEIARDYVENLGRKCNYSDVEEIAKLQVKQFNECKNTEPKIIFLDTWLIVTKIWFDVVFHKEPDWLADEIKNTKIDLFLVCDTDLPWIPDRVRENGGEMRNVLQNKYIDTISKYNFKYKIVQGADRKRLEQAIQFINELQ